MTKPSTNSTENFFLSMSISKEETFVRFSLRSKDKTLYGRCNYSNGISLYPIAMYQPSMQECVSEFQWQFEATQIHEFLHALMGKWKIPGRCSEKKIGWIDGRFTFILKSHDLQSWNEGLSFWSECFLPDLIQRWRLAQLRKKYVMRNARAKNLIQHNRQKTLLEFF